MKSKFHIFSLLAVLTIFVGCHCDCECDSEPETITIQPDETTGKDASIANCIPCGYNDNNYGSTADFVVAAWTNEGNSSDIRELLQFDLTAIPITATVISAKLSLYYKNSPGNGDHSGSNESYLQKVTSAWDENTVTWDTQPSATMAGQISVDKSLSDTQDFIDIDITLLVQEWVKTPSTNYGLLMRIQNETPYRRLSFASSDHTDATKRPRLVVEYK